MVEELLNQLKEMQRLILADDEILRNQAQILRKMYDELKKAGFSSEQALQIVANQGIGMKASG